MSSLSSPILLAIFVAAGAAIWVAGVKLSNTTDVLSTRLGLGEALGGLILLAIATNLPEIAITVSAASSGHLDVAVSNILGGIAIQTVVLVALDAFGVRERQPLTYLAASLALVLEGALVVALLAIVVMGTQMPSDMHWLRISPAPVAIALVWIVGLLILNKAQTSLPWQNGGHAPDSQAKPQGHAENQKEADATAAKRSTARVAAVFLMAAVVTCICGVLLEQSGEEFFGRQGFSGVLFGATVLAAATALPELSTGITSTRMGDYKLAISDIFGGNAFLPVLFLVAAVVSNSAVLPAAHRSDIYLTALGALLTLIYMTGLVFRPQRQRFRLGIDSIAVLVIYVVGIAGLALIQN